MLANFSPSKAAQRQGRVRACRGESPSNTFLLTLTTFLCFWMRFLSHGFSFLLALPICVSTTFTSQFQNVQLSSFQNWNLEKNDVFSFFCMPFSVYLFLYTFFLCVPFFVYRFWRIFELFQKLVPLQYFKVPLVVCVPPFENNCCRWDIFNENPHQVTWLEVGGGCGGLTCGAQAQLQGAAVLGQPVSLGAGGGGHGGHGPGGPLARDLHRGPQQVNLFAVDVLHVVLMGKETRGRN